MLRIILATLLLVPTLAQGSSIVWDDWTPAPFERAKRENKLILLDVGMEGCTACRRMDEITYTHSEVVRLVNQHFVTISVDSEARPDIGERYSDWAWPAIIFMAPDSTQVLALRGNRMPRNFIPILNELIAKHAAGQLSPDELAPYSAPPAPATTELTILRDRLRGQLDRNLNEQTGGWSKSGVGTTAGAPLRHLYMRAHLYDQAELRRIALQTTEGYRRALDPVWGGVFIVTFNKGGFIPEKRISNQANALNAFSDAYQLTGDTVYLDAIDSVDKYLNDWMMSATGTFFTSQEDDAPGLPSDMRASDYYKLDSDVKRRKFGIPPIDHAVYTDKNGEVIAAFARAYEATGNAKHLKTALRAANSLIQERGQDAGWMLQAGSNPEVITDNRMRRLPLEKRPFLSAQAWFGQALLSLYRVTGDEQWLGQAKTLSAAMISELQDDNIGGFYASPPDETAALIPPRKPLEHNAVAASFLYDLWVYTKDEGLTDIPEQTLRAVAVPSVIRREGKITGQTALALEKLTSKYVEFSVVGPEKDSAAQALFVAGRDTYEPRKLLHFEAPGRYPARDVPAMYICNPDACSLPIEDPAKVATIAKQFRGPAR